MVITAEIQKGMVIITIMARQKTTGMVIIIDVAIETIIIAINMIIEIINVFCTWQTNDSWSCIWNKRGRS